MLSAHNTDRKEEVFMVLESGELVLYIGFLDIVCYRGEEGCGWLTCKTATRVVMNFLIKRKVIESLGRL